MTQTKRREVPVNLRQSGNSSARVLIDTRVRKGPYWHLSEQHGVWAYSIHSAMYRPRAYVPLEEGGLLKEYEYLTEGVTLWDAATERQIRIKGQDALDFVDLLVTRDIKNTTPPGQARYVILCYEDGGIVNDPILLRVAEDEVWLSTHTEVLPWARGVHFGTSYEVEIDEIDVGPLQIQGPQSKPLMEKLARQGVLGAEVPKLRYYKLCRTKLNGIDVVVSRTGFTGEVGYEVYPYDSSVNGETVWNTLLEAGAEFGIKVIAPSHIRRLEAGILSYGADMDAGTNPFEVGLDRQVDFAKTNFIGKEALEIVARRGVSRKLAGLRMGGRPITWYNPDFWIAKDLAGQEAVGYLTSAFYSPKLRTNIALAMLPLEWTTVGTRLTVALPDEERPVAASVVEVPFFDPRKEMPLAR